MAQIPFIGPSYTLRSVTADCQKTVNLFPVKNELGTGKSNFFLQGTPGIKLYQTIETLAETTTIRAMFTNSKDELFVIAGSSFVKIYLDEFNEITQRALGSLATTTGKAAMADNGFQIGIVDGDNYYIYNYETDVFEQYYNEDAPFPGSDTITYFSSYFVFIERNTQKFFITKPLDPYTLDPLDFASAEYSPDNLITSIALNQSLYLFGKNTIEVWYNSGASDFPLQTMNGGAIQFGCIAPYSVVNCMNAPVFLGRDSNGAGTIYMINGNSCERISNLAVEYFIQNEQNIEDAVAYSYQQEGHYFYVINFPSAKTTWAFDFTTQLWHERQYFNTTTAIPERQRQQYHVYWNKKHLVSDYSLNKIYEMSLDFYDDDGNPIQRIRRSPHLQNPELDRMFFAEFQLDLDVGDPFYMSYSDKPKIHLRFSDDGAKTWSNILTVTLDKKGNYKTRAIWRRLGSSRDRIWEVSLTDPIKVVWLSAKVN